MACGLSSLAPFNSFTLIYMSPSYRLSAVAVLKLPQLLSQLLVAPVRTWLSSLC